MFCFHGYGESGESFALLKGFLAKDFTMYCIDLPFHGKTEWKEEVAFAPDDLVEVIKLVSNFSNQKICLLGYSLGGRVCLQMLELIAAEISEVVLLAPDGLHKNFWYSFSTQTKIGNSLFKSSVQNSSTLFFLLKISEELKLMNKSILKIAHHYLDDENERMLLYKRWTVMRKFNPVQGLIKKNVLHYNISLKFIFGKFDNIILSNRSKIFMSLKKNVRIKILDAGHQLLKEKYVNEIASFINQQ